MKDLIKIPCQQVKSEIKESKEVFKRASTPTVTKSKIDFNILKINTPNYK